MEDLVNDSCNSFLSTEPNSIDPNSQLYNFIIVGLLTTIVLVFGIFGNICSGIVLSRPKMKSSLNCLLLGLTVCDSILLINTFLIFTLPSILEYFNIGSSYSYYVQYMTPPLYALGMTAQTGSIYFTVAVTTERFIAVCHPLRARSLCTWKGAKYYSLGVLIFSIIYNIPRWFEFYTGQVPISRNSTETNPSVLMTQLRCNELYFKIYIHWANFFIMSLFPITTLIVFNAFIYSEIEKTNSRRQDLSKYQNREISLAVMLLVVVAVFLFCNILPFVCNFMESMQLTISQNLIGTSNLLVTVNSSVNCLIYCVFGTKFRKEFFRFISSSFPCLPDIEVKTGKSYNTTTTIGLSMAAPSRFNKRSLSVPCNNKFSSMTLYHKNIVGISQTALI